MIKLLKKDITRKAFLSFFKSTEGFYKQNFYLCGIVFLFFSFSVQAQDKCKELFRIEAFSKSMTENLELGKDQRGLFDLYKASSFGEPKTSIKNSFDDLMDVLAEHPELSKELFREQEITFRKRHYESPESLNNFIKRFTGVYGSLKSKLFYVSENLYFWQKLLGFNKSDQKDFNEYLEDLLSAKERDYLADKSISYKERAVFLYKVLDKVREIKKDVDVQVVQRLSQIMLDLVHTVGLGNHYNSAMLKSKNAIDRLQALYKILSARDAMAIELGFEDHFLGLQSALGLSSPSSFLKTEDIYSMLRSIEKETLQSSSYLLGYQTFRLRALSIQESPFRSCLGGSDCSSNTYFFKALDPNFTYWTLTDKDHKSSGQITVVLGKAEDEQGKRLEVGFVDKIQNVPTERIEPMLEGIRRSLKEKGYKLGLSQNVGDHNGLSNEQTTREYVAKELNPKLERELLEFEPHENAYNFTNMFSRAYQEPELYEFKAGSLEVKIESGKIHQIQKASEDLKVQDLFDQILSLRSSKSEEDQIRFIKQVELLYNLKILSFKELRGDLMFWIKDKGLSLKLRKLSLFALIELYAVLEKKLSYEEIVDLFTLFSKEDQKTLMGEMSNWGSGNDLNRKDFIKGLFMEREDIHSILKSELLNPFINASVKNLKSHAPLIWAIEYRPEMVELLIEKAVGIHWNVIELFIYIINHGQADILKLLIEKGIDIHAVDSYGENALMYAVKNNFPEIVKFLIQKGIDIHAVDSFGHNALVYAIRNNSPEIVKLLIEKGIDINSVDVERQSVLMYAIENNQPKIAKLLISKGADIHVINSGGKNALMYAIKYNQEEIAKLLIETGIDIHAVDSFGANALVYTTITELLEITNLLIRKGIDIHAVNFFGKNALMYAIEHNAPKIAEMLIEKGIDIHAVDSNGKSALMYTMEHDQAEIAELLIKKGIDIHAVDEDGKSALMYALESERPEIEKLLEVQSSKKAIH